MLSDVKRLRALLEAARMYLTMNGGSADDRIVRCIDEELARPEIEWTPDTFWGEGAIEARVDGVHVNVYPIEWADDDAPWNWSISRSEIGEVGDAATKEEAVAAALKAAGVK